MLVGSAALLGVGAQPAAAASGPFSCQPGFYQVMSGQLKQLNPLTGVYTSIGPTSQTYNAMGYNVADNYLYALSTAAGTLGHLLKIASDGTMTDLGLPAGLPAFSIVSGDFDDHGDLIVQSNPTTYYSINVATKAATPLNVTGDTASAADMVWVNGTVYSMSGSTLRGVNLATGVSTSATVAGVSGATFGSGWSDRPDELFFSDNTSGKIYKITDFTTAAPTGTLQLNGTPTGNNDGAACKQADSPFNPPTANSDSYTATTNQPLNVGAGSGVLANDVGSNLTATKTTDAAHGTVTLNADGSFAYTPSAGYVGTDSFTYTPTDQFGQVAIAPATVTITVKLPSAPAATDDSFSTAVDQSINTSAGAGVLANDTGTGVTVTGYTQPAHGSVTVSGTGAVSYTPPAGYSGTQTFGYTITDGFGRTSTATVNLATTPTGSADSYTTDANQSLDVPAATGVLANDNGTGLAFSGGTGASHGTLTIRADGSFTYTPVAGYYGTDSFTYEAVDSSGQHTASITVSLGISAPPAPASLPDTYTTTAGSDLNIDAAAGVLANDSGTGITVTSNSPAAHGSVTIDPNGAVSYSPPAGYSGTQTISYTVTDSVGHTATATVTLTTTPTAVDDGAYSTLADHDLNVDAALGVLANDIGSGLTATLGSAPSHGTLILNADGSFDYTPAIGYHGSDSFTYTATDTDGLTTPTKTVALTINMPATPIATDDTYTTGTGQVLNVSAAAGVLANDSGTGIAVSSSSSAAHGVVSLGPDGAMTFTPQPGYSGSENISYTITDEFGRTATAAVHVSITPAATDDSYATTANQTLTAAAATGVLANDIGTGLTAALGAAPAHGSLTLNTDGSFSYTPAANYVGADTFTYVATDGDGQSAAAHTVTLSIGLPAAPHAQPHTLATTAGQQLTVAAAEGLLLDSTGTDVTVTGYTQPAHGEVRVAPDGSLTLHADDGSAGSDTFTYTITDVWGRTSIATVTVTVTIVPPSTTQTKSVPVTGTLTVPASQGVLAGVPGTNLHAILVGRPMHGRVVLNDDGSYSYVPDPGYAGTDTFGYTVLDDTHHVILRGTVKLVVPAQASTAPSHTTSNGTPTTTPSTGSAALASTGVDVMSDLLIGALLLASGSGLLLFGRRPARRRAVR